jgi:hypothetical protein
VDGRHHVLAGARPNRSSGSAGRGGQSVQPLVPARHPCANRGARQPLSTIAATIAAAAAAAATATHHKQRGETSPMLPGEQLGGM